MELLINEQQNSYQNSKICYICKEKFKNKYVKDKKYVKLEINVIIQGNIEMLCICNLKYSVPKKISVGFYNGSNDDYNFIVNGSPEEFLKISLV